MPQELHVLRCYSCEAFQVHIVKKSPKWECKLCGEKQSIKKVYGRGSGKECRLYVQELNQKRVESNQQPIIDVVVENSDSQIETFKNEVCNDVKPNRWADFVSSPTTANSDEETDSNKYPNYTFEQPIKKGTNKCMKIPQTLLVPEENNEGESANTSAIHGRWSNNVNNKEEKQHNEASNDIFARSSKSLQLKRKLKDVYQESHPGENQYPNIATNQTSVTVKSSRWEEFVSPIGTVDSNEEEKQNQIPGYTFEQPTNKKHKLTPLKKKCTKTTQGLLIDDKNGKEVCSFISAVNKNEKEEKDTTAIPPKHLSKPQNLQLIQKLEDTDQESYTKENSREFSDVRNKTFVDVKSNKWGEFISSNGSTLSDETGADYLLSNMVEQPHQTTQNEFKEDQSKQKKCNTNSSFRSENPTRYDNILQSNLFNAEENNLDSIFTF